MGLIFIVIIVPLVLCIAAATAGIAIMRALTGAFIAKKELCDATRTVSYLAIIALSVYALYNGFFSPRLPAWH